MEKNTDAVMKYLIDRLKEELHDVSTYSMLYEELEELDKDREAKYVEQIAREEYSHAMALSKILHINHRYPDSEELVKLWETAKRNFE